MFFPEKLWTPSARDVQMSLLQPLHVKIPITGAFNTITVIHTPPRGFVDIIAYIHTLGTPGAGQNYTLYNLSIFDVVGGNSICEIFESAAPGGANVVQNSAIGLQHLVLPEGENLNYTISFNAAVANNTAILNIIGMRIPRGNFQLR